MALNWDFKKLAGYAQVRVGEEEVKYKLYQGNAYLIFVYEYEENGEEYYTVPMFFVDRDHAKNCLGLNKKQGYTENILCRPSFQLQKIMINKKQYRYTEDLVKLLTKAFDFIDITIWSLD